MIAFLLCLLGQLDFAPCEHGPTEPAPVYDDAHRTATRQIIRDAVDELGGSEGFARYLVAVAVHESSLRRGLVHRLDIAASRRAWTWRRAALRRAGNPWADEPAVWLTYGLFGMSSPYYAHHIDPAADPRMLCDAWTSVVVYARAALVLLPKLRRCIGRPTWADLYSAVQLGRACGRRRRGDFGKLARAHGLDVRAELRPRDFGG